MTRYPQLALHAHRRATALLLAAVALPSIAQAQESVTPPIVVVPTVPAPAPAPVQSAPVTPGESRTTIAPGVLEQAAQEERERAAARQAEARAQQAAQRAERPAPRAAAPVAQPAPVVADPEPVTEAAPAVPAVTAPPVEAADTSVAPAAIAPVPPVQGNGGTVWLIVAALGGLAALLAAAALMRRRRSVEPQPAYVADEEASYTPQPEAVPVASRTVAPDPIAAAPAFIAPRPVAAPVNAARHKPVAVKDRSGLQHPELVEPEAEDIAAIMGDPAPRGSRPQLELGMRPTRAGVGRRDATVEFELTIANSGGLPAEDVRVGAFMLGAGSATSREIERMLVSPPVDSIVPADRIAPGDGTRLDAAVTLPRDQVEALIDESADGFTPVLVADARYRLPDGREGRTAAAFTIGRVNGGTELVPIALHDDPSMYDDIEARLHSMAARV